MSDLISRADAVKAIEELPNCYNGWSDTYDKAYIITTLEEVPSVSAEPSEKGGDAEMREQDFRPRYMQQTPSEDGSDLISRADTLAKIKEYCIDGDSVVHKWFDTMGIEEVINTMPSVSAERVGVWEYDFDKDDHYCTRCHKYAGDWEMNLLSDYCPSCGARMENEK